MNPKVKAKMLARIKVLERHLEAMSTTPSIPQYAKHALGPANKWLAQELRLLNLIRKSIGA